MQIYGVNKLKGQKMLVTEAEKGHPKIFCKSEKKYLESISFRQIAFKKFVKSKKQFKILV